MKCRASGFFLVLVLLTIFSGCAHKSDLKNRESTIRIGTIHRVRAENPLYDYALGIFTMISNPPLLQLNSNGEIEGLLAESYGCSGDYSEWKFIIRNNFYWNDGVPVTPEDVKFTLEYLGNHVPSRRWIQKTLIRAEASSDHGVVFAFNKPYTRLDMELTSMRIFPKHTWEKVKKPQYYEGNGIDIYTGYGPFVISGIDLNAGLIVMKKNPFWKGKKPVIDTIEIHMYRNLDMLSLALEKGHVDSYYKYADSYPYTNINRLRETGNFRFLEYADIGLILLGFNLKKKPMSDISFRNAVTHALNYKEILRLTNNGYGEIPDRGFISRDMLYFKETGKLKQDINRAQELLLQAGYKDGDSDGIIENFAGENITLLLLSTPPYLRLCELVKDYLLRAGIGVEVKIVDNATWINLKDQYHYDITITRTTPWGMHMHAGWATGYFDSRRSGEGVLHIVDDPYFLKLCDSVLAAKDPGQLEQYARAIQDYYAEKLPAAALIRKKAVLPFHKSFTGWYTDPIYGILNVRNFLNLRRVNALH